MDFISLLPAGAAQPRRISPTDLAQRIRLGQRRRYLRERDGARVGVWGNRR